MRTSVTPEFLKSRVKRAEYHRFPDTTLTICVLTLANGFKVTGESACVDPANFNVELGERIAYDNAFEKLWSLEGYLLAEERYVAQLNAGVVHPLDHIASICHEANRGYCEALGDFSQVPWSEAPEWQRESARMGVDFHLMGDFGPEASHVSWMKVKELGGWKYGPVKDAEKREHPRMVPFEELPPEQRAKDYIFRAIVHNFKEGQ